MKIDPRLQVGLGLSVHSVFLCRTPGSAAAVLGVVILAWSIIRQTSARVVLLWAGFQIILIAIFSLSWWLGRDTEEYALWTFLHWSTGLTGGLLVVLWPGIENLAKVMLRLPLPTPLTRSFGFALRTVPILSTEIASHNRHLKILDHVGSRARANRRLLLGMAEILAQTIDGIDKIITQIETRGFDAKMFGSLRPLTVTAGNIVALAALSMALAIPLISNLL